MSQVRELPAPDGCGRTVPARLHTQHAATPVVCHCQHQQALYVLVVLSPPVCPARSAPPCLPASLPACPALPAVPRRYSEEFEKTFMEHMKQAHPRSRIAATVVYNEFINDRWGSGLGSIGGCVCCSGYTPSSLCPSQPLRTSATSCSSLAPPLPPPSPAPHAHHNPYHRHNPSRASRTQLQFSSTK